MEPFESSAVGVEKSRAQGSAYFRPSVAHSASPRTYPLAGAVFSGKSTFTPLVSPSETVQFSKLFRSRA
jgi:hypothetical protein